MRKTKRILVVGASGMLGKDITKLFSTLDDYDIYGLSRNTEHVLPYSNVRSIHIDVTDRQALTACLEQIRPDIIVHSGAVSNVDACEEDSSYALLLHGGIIETIASVVPDAKLIYISTDSVFNGISGNYRESDIPQPINNYARSKYFGEQNTIRLMREHIVVRTNIFGYHLFDQTSLSEWAFSNLRSGKAIIGFNDVYFNPLYTGQLSHIILNLIEIRYNGIINVVSDIVVNKYEFLFALAKEFGYDTSLIESTSIDTHNFRAARPKDTSLNPSQLKSVLKKLPTLAEGLAQFHTDYDDFIETKATTYE